MQHTAPIIIVFCRAAHGVTVVKVNGADIPPVAHNVIRSLATDNRDAFAVGIPTSRTLLAVARSLFARDVADSAVFATARKLATDVDAMISRIDTL